MNNDDRDFPAEVLRLFQRERELAQLVYTRGSATARDIETLLTSPITNAATRSMLNRLVAKGILTRLRKDGSLEYEYRPAITDRLSQERAVKELAEDFFGGSLGEVASAIAGIARRDADETVAA